MRCDFEDDEAAEGPIIYWRSIILSLLGETVFPYHRYLRMLDLVCLRDLVFYMSYADNPHLML